MFLYLLFLLILLPFIALSAWASAKVNSTYAKYDAVFNRSGMTGYDAATRLLRNRGATDITVNRVAGRLSDHYNPAKSQVNLSESTYGSPSVAAVAVAAHEIGHVMQKKKGYVPYRIRNFLVPLANVGSRLALPVVIVGLLLELIWASTTNDVGLVVVYVGIGLYSLSSLFMLVTLPVELNASRRAKKMLVEDGILSEEELPGARRVLTAAAMTYVASLLISLIYFLRFLVIVLALAGRRRK